MKTTVVINLVALGFVVSFFVGIAYLLSHVYGRMIKDDKVPAGWADNGGIKAQLVRGVQQSADGQWKPLIKKIWLAFLIVDLLAVIIVLIS